MPTTSYVTLNGRVSSLAVGLDPGAISPSVGGRIDLLSDALGSVVRTVSDDSTNGGETLRYAGYGGVLYEAGGWAQPRGSWLGSLGYRSTQMKHAEKYVRARHYAASAGRWTSVDPLWPGEAAYGYVAGNPTNRVDPSGMKISVDSSCGGAVSGMSDCCGTFGKMLDSGGNLKQNISVELQRCMADKNFPNSKTFIEQAIKNFANLCSGGAGDLCVKCVQTPTYPGGIPAPSGCKPCGELGNAGGSTIWPIDSTPPPIRVPPGSGCTWFYVDKKDPCAPLHDPNSSCGSTIVLCTAWPTPGSQCQTAFHESIHAGGVGGPPEHSDHTKPHIDIIYALACCVCEKLYGKGNRDCNANCRGFA